MHRRAALTLACLGTLVGCGEQEVAPDSRDSLTRSQGPRATAPETPVPQTGRSVRGVAFSPRDLRALARMTPLTAPAPDPTNRWADDPAAARLGQALFFDPGLSANGKVSCASCHEPARAFSSGEALSEGLGRGTRHAPSLLGAGHQRWLGWGGRADSLWAQALIPLLHPLEMGSAPRTILRHVRETPGLEQAWRDVFGPLPALEADAVSDGASQNGAIELAFSRVGKAIAAYERRLVRSDAPFDRFAAALLERPGAEPGDLELLDAPAVRGLAIFLGHGKCVLCHSGPNFSDGEFHNTGVPPGPEGDGDDPGRHRGVQLVRADPFNAAGPYSDDPNGPAAERVTGLRTGSETWGEFRTPSLRNLGTRGPFMHQGQLATLADVVHFYDTLEGSVGRSHHQESILEPLELGESGRADLMAFLASLEGLPLDPALERAPN